jgi:hypothetical protein
VKVVPFRTWRNLRLALALAVAAAGAVATGPGAVSAGHSWSCYGTASQPLRIHNSSGYFARRSGGYSCTNYVHSIEYHVYLQQYTSGAWRTVAQRDRYGEQDLTSSVTLSRKCASYSATSWRIVTKGKIWAHWYSPSYTTFSRTSVTNTLACRA